MLYEDGQRLIMVSDDPELKKAMVELNKQFEGNANTVQVPLVPVVGEKKTEDVPVETVQPKMSLDERYRAINDLAPGTAKQGKILVLKNDINAYLRKLEKQPMSTRQKLVHIVKTLPTMIKSQIVSAYSKLGYANFSDFAEAEPEKLETLYRDVYNILMVRTST